MPDTAAEIHCTFFAPILDHAFEQIGRARTHEVLASLGTTEEALRDRSGWVSLARTEAIATALARASGNPEFTAEASRRMVVGRYLGLIKPVMQVMGSPRQVFAQFPSLSSAFNKVGTWEIHDLTDASVTLRYESAPEQSLHMCKGRCAQLTVIPVVFGLPPAEVDHVQCMHEGADACVYEIAWAVDESPRPLLVASLASAAVLGALGWGLGAPALACAVLALAGAGLGWAMVEQQWLRGQLELRASQLLEQHGALRSSLADSHRRFEELLEAKRDVDRQVEHRTRELQETTDQLAEALEEVQRAGELRTRFFANVSHELRTPLQLILGPLRELASGREPPGGQARCLEAMHRSARRLHRLIDQLLDLARADAEPKGAQRVAVDPAGLVRLLGETFTPTALGRGIELCVEASEEVPPAQLDPHWIESALTNLTANALRHCDAGDVVRLGVTADDEVIRFVVADTGPGIPPEDLPTIFDRFAQSVQKEGGPRGTGLGLAIVQQAAVLHGGEATVSSVLGQGTTFELVLPWVAARDGDEVQALEVPADVSDDVAADLPDVLEVPGPHADAPVAVVAEDEPDVRSYVAHVLARRFRVIACADGEHALEQVRQTMPDLLVTDQTMPRRTGIELIRTLRADPATARVPMLLLTAHQTVEEVLAGYDAGADDYVIKPFHGRELLARVEVHLRVRQLTREATVRERLASVGMLSAELAHHIRNPLNMLKNGLTLVGQGPGPLDDDDRELLHEMQDAAERIALLTTDLLRLARGHQRAEPAPHHPGQGLRAAVRLMRSALPAHVVLELGEVAEGLVHGIAGDLNQVFLNLLDNAVRAVGDEGRVGCRTAVLDGTYVITVEDDGPGVPDELRAHLFEAFVSSRAYGEGAGLGLAIAANVVRDHGGEIEVSTSAALGGACFRITLPMVASTSGEAASAQAPAAETPSARPVG